MDSQPNTVETVNKTESGPPAYAQPYLEDFLAASKASYEDPNNPGFFPGNTFVPLSGQTEAGLTGIENAATAGSPIASAGQDEYLKTIQGGYLSPDSNPFLQGTIDAATRPITENFTQNYIPGVNSTFSLAGRYGAENQKEALRSGLDTTNRNIGETAGNIAYQNYGNERGLQAGAVAGAPDYAARRYDDPNALLGVGAQREAQSGKELQDAIARFDFGSNREQNKLNQYGANLRQGVYGGSGTQTGQTPYFGGDPFAQTLGAGLGIAGAAGGLGYKPFAQDK